MEDDYVWYVTYGSNMLLERFLYYIQGVSSADNKFNGRAYPKCSDCSPPIAEKSVILPYQMFYSQSSNSWGGSAVCFLDVNNPGIAYCRAYLIKRVQLEHVHEREGKGWYPKQVPITGVKELDGYPAYTITNLDLKDRKSYDCVLEGYRKVLFKGMKESFPSLSVEEIEDYLRSCGEKETSRS